MNPQPPIAPPALPLVLGEGRAALEWAQAHWLPNWPLWQRAQPGDGHAVLVLPGLLTDDAGTRPLRQVLTRVGYQALPWEQGINRGPTPALMQALHDRIRRANDETGQSVSLVGWSLGGALAYALAAAHPTRIRRLITLSAPLSGSSSHATHARKAYALASGRTEATDADLQALLARAPKVPVTAITSRQDGVITWSATTLPARLRGESLLVQATHWGLPANAHACWVVAQRLGQPAGAWRPYLPSLDDTPWLPNTEVLVH
jgi:pimeloyl-ACP methyl ester carboxylesterase